MIKTLMEEIEKSQKNAESAFSKEETNIKFDI